MQAIKGRIEVHRVVGTEITDSYTQRWHCGESGEMLCTTALFSVGSPHDTTRLSFVVRSCLSALASFAQQYEVDEHYHWSK